jgi:glycosyltransferase involved in cell wall biosynthesis
MVISLYQGQIENAVNVILPEMIKPLYLKHYFSIKNALRSFKPDILHAHHASSYGFLGALQNFHPFVVSVWGYDVLLFPQKSPLHRLVIKYTLHQADKITATSNALAKSVADLVGRTPEIIPFGVDKNFLRVNRDYNKRDLVIGIIKDLKPVYGIDVLIKAFAGLVNKGYPVKLLIVGEGKLKGKFVNLCQQLNIQNYVTFKSRVPHSEVIDLLKRIDIFVIPSYSEGFGVAAVEAMATGLPVVASNVGGLPEVIDDGKTGILVKPGDVEALKRALEYYILSKDARINHGQRAREKVEAFYDWQKNAEAMNRLYREIFSERGFN